MSDLISRQAAIDAIEEYADRLQMVDWKENPGVPYKVHALNWCVNTIRELPPAQPTYNDEEIQKMQDLEQAQIEKAYQLGYEEGKKDAQPERKNGRWIMHIDDLFPEESTMECNQCHEHQPITIDDNFCPNCGAEMQKGEADAEKTDKQN